MGTGSLNSGVHVAFFCLWKTRTLHPGVLKILGRKLALCRLFVLVFEVILVS